MEKKNLKMKNNFTQLIGQVSKLYKEVSNTTNESYLLGKKEAYEDILNWFITSHNGELKYISANSFFNIIQEKLIKTKTALATRTSEETGEEEIKQQVNFSDIKISDNRKRVNRWSGNEPDQIVVEEDSIGAQVNFPVSVSSLINTTNNSNSFSLGSNWQISNANNSSIINNNTNNITSSNNLNSDLLNTTMNFTSINSLSGMNNTSNQQNNILNTNSNSNNALVNPIVSSIKKKKK